MKRLLAFIFACSLLTAEEPNLAIHNRPLVKINGRQISVIDVMKKMNAFIYQNYPEAVNNKAMLFQFYAGNWRATLDDIINNELMLLEAEAKEIKVSDGDVREEVEARYGPNIMANLHAIDLTLDEARSLIHTELIVGRVMWMNVHQKALQEITPQKVKEAYAGFVAANPPTDRWVYQVFSVRGKNEELCEKISSEAAKIVGSKIGDLAKAALDIQESFKEEPDLPKITVSEEFDLEGPQVSEQHLTVLEALKPGTYSEPISQKSRVDGSTVWRIFYLKDREDVTPPEFEAISERLKNQLLQERFGHYSQTYYKKLRAQYNMTKEQIDAIVPTSFNPFQLN